MEENRIKSANWHITSRCNYCCKFCFARDRGHELTDLDRITEILTTLRDKGVEKINFAGGEPLLHPRLRQMLSVSKALGMVTSIVTNGSCLNARVIDGMRDDLDWLGLSVDSSDDEVERSLGRGQGRHVEHARDVVPIVHDRGIKLKVNTVVTSANFMEDMRPLIGELDPQRWKVFQYLHVEGVNDEHDDLMRLSSDEFSSFVTRNGTIRLRDGNRPVFETNEDMVGSYLMVSPDGQLTVNQNESYAKVGWDRFRREPMSKFIDEQRYMSRGGLYDWL